MKLIQKYPGLVERHYTMNPKTEVLSEAMNLENGMMVLIAGVVHRYEIQGKDEQDYDGINTSLLLTSNRWCIVKDFAAFGNTVTFIGAYPDGRESKRICRKNDVWLVKKALSAVEIPSVDYKRAKILDAIRKVLSESRNGDEAVAKATSVAVDKIMKLI